MRYENVRVGVIVTSMGLDVRLLGVPRVLRDGRPASFETRKAMALLAHLALAERPRSREALCALLWPDLDPDRGRGALRRTLSTLRSGIGEEWVEVVGDSVALRRAPDLQFDVARFRALAADAPSEKRLSQAVALFAGEFMEGFSLRDSPDFDDWQAGEGRGLERELGSVLRLLVAELVARGEYDRALPHARRWLEVDPLHEPAHRELIRLYAWSGERASALEQYRQCVRTLSEELGVAPLAETAALYEQVNDGSLAQRVEAPPTAEPSLGAKRAAAPADLLLVGREQDLNALLDAHAQARVDGCFAVIEGEAGIGKTRLAAELTRRVEGDGGVVLAARCHEDEAGLPYGPVVELLREAARRAGADGWPAAVPATRLADASLLLPELADLVDGRSSPLPLVGDGAHVRLLEGVAAVLSAACTVRMPGVVFVDDVHAADEATLDTISYLAHRLARLELLLMVAWRSEAIPPGHRVRRLAADLTRDGRATIVRPRRLSEDEVARLIPSVQADDAVAALARRVYLESEGLPLFVAEYLAAVRTDGELAVLPSEVRNLLDARVRGLSDVASQVLGAAAVIGRSFDLETLRDASGRTDEETVGALEELVGRGMVSEASEGDAAYDFSHEKLRALIYEQMGLARRRLLHGRVAAVAKARLRERPAVLAQHLRLAGDQEAAAAQHRLAAQQAAGLHAHADALEHLEAALALGASDSAELHEEIGDVRTLLGDYSGALGSYEVAAAHAAPEARPAIEHKLGNVHDRRGEWDRAESRFQAALAAAPAAAAGLRARIHADLALALHHGGRNERAAALADKALALAESAGDRRAQAQAHNLVGILARHAGDSRTAVRHLEQSLTFARDLDDTVAEVAALNNLALVKRDEGSLREAVVLTGTALALCAAYGDRHREAALENNIADIHHAAGENDEAMVHLKRAVGIFSEVGADDATRLPEIWKLASW